MPLIHLELGVSSTAIITFTMLPQEDEDHHVVLNTIRGNPPAQAGGIMH